MMRTLNLGDKVRYRHSIISFLQDVMYNPPDNFPSVVSGVRDDFYISSGAYQISGWYRGFNHTLGQEIFFYLYEIYEL